MTAFTSPKTYTASVAHTAAEGNTYIRDNIKNLDERLTLIGQTSVTVVGQIKSAAYGCVLLREAAQTINDATDTAITFPTAGAEELDTDSFHSAAVNTSRITVPAGGGGWYDIGGHVQFETDNDGIRAVWVDLNGITTIVQTRVAAVTGTQTMIGVSTLYLLAAGDYVTLNVRQTAGAVLDVAANGYSPRFWAVRRFTV